MLTILRTKCTLYTVQLWAHPFKSRNDIFTIYSGCAVCVFATLQCFLLSSILGWRHIGMMYEDRIYRSGFLLLKTILLLNVK
jgi:hypothetical protein